MADLGYGRCVGTARHYPRVREVFGAETQRERKKREVWWYDQTLSSREGGVRRKDAA